MMTARFFAVVFVAVVFVNGALGQSGLLGRLTRPIINAGSSFFKYSNVEPISSVVSQKILQSSITTPTTLPTTTPVTYPVTTPTIEITSTPKPTIPKMNSNDFIVPKNNAFNWFKTNPISTTLPTIYQQSKPLPDSPLKGLDDDTTSTLAKEGEKEPSYFSKLIAQGKVPGTYNPFLLGMLEPSLKYPLVLPGLEYQVKEDGVPLPNVKPPYYEKNETEAITPTEFTKLNARIVDLDLDLTNGSIDLSNQIAEAEKDVNIVDLMHPDNESNKTLGKTDKVKYFSVEVQTENRTIHIKIGKFERNLTVGYFVQKYEQLLKVTKPLAYWLDNPLVNYIMTKTPLSQPFNMLKTAVNMINNPKKAYEIFQKKYPIGSIAVDLAVAIYKDPSKTKDHIKATIPKASQAIVDWHKKKKEEEAKDSNRSLVARKLAGFRRVGG